MVVLISLSFISANVEAKPRIKYKKYRSTQVQKPVARTVQQPSLAPQQPSLGRIAAEAGTVGLVGGAAAGFGVSAGRDAYEGVKSATTKPECFTNNKGEKFCKAE